MKLLINGEHILFSAIESIRYDDSGTGQIVVRTVSGKEHTRACTKELSGKAIESLFSAIRLHSAI